MALTVNGTEYPLPEDPRVSLLDLLRERLGLTGTKVGCNQGACGACTVLVDGRRVLSCLTLAVQADGGEVTTIEGLAAADGELHGLQQAFLEHDGLQCGYCTPGQICSALGMIGEAAAGFPSHVTADLAAMPALTREEIRERMSGNLCRCGAHNGIIEAIEQFTRSDASQSSRFTRAAPFEEDRFTRGEASPAGGKFTRVEAAQGTGITGAGHRGGAA